MFCLLIVCFLLYLVCPLLPVVQDLNCQFMIAPWVFTNVYLNCRNVFSSILPRLRRMLYVKQELLNLLEHLSSPLVVHLVCVAHLLFSEFVHINSLPLFFPFLPPVFFSVYILFHDLFFLSPLGIFCSSYNSETE